MKARRVRRGARRGGERRAQAVLTGHRDRVQGDVALGGRARAPQVSRSRFRMVNGCSILVSLVSRIFRIDPKSNASRFFT